MVEVVFSESALNDLDSITNYISLDSLRYAQEFANRVFERVEQLQFFQIPAELYLNLTTDYYEKYLSANTG